MLAYSCYAAKAQVSYELSNAKTALSSFAAEASDSSAVVETADTSAADNGFSDAAPVAVPDSTLEARTTSASHKLINSARCALAPVRSRMRASCQARIVPHAGSSFAVRASGRDRGCDRGTLGMRDGSHGSVSAVQISKRAILYAQMHFARAVSALMADARMFGGSISSHLDPMGNVRKAALA